MEQLVEGVALKFLSRDPASFVGPLKALQALRKEAWVSAQDRNTLCRLLQELLAYKRGAVIQKLMQQIMQKGSLEKSLEAGELCVLSAEVLAELTESVAVARFCATDARALAKALLDQHADVMRQAFVFCRESVPRREDWQPFVKKAVEITRCFINLSRASKTFRLELQEFDQFFPTVLKLTTDTLGKLLDSPMMIRILPTLILLLETFAQHEDSRAWAMEQGLLRVVAMTTRMSWATSTSGDVKGLDRATWRIEVARYREVLSEMEEEMRLEKKPQRRRRVEDRHLEGMLVKLQVVEANLKHVMTECPSQEIEEYEAMVRWLSWGLSKMETPAVCSWEMCENGSGRRFSKCASCCVTL